LPPPGRVVGPNRSRAGQRGRRPLRERLASTTTALRDSNRWRGVSSRALRCAATTRARGCAFLRLRAALKRRSAFMTCMSGTLGQSTTHGDGRDDAPLCKNASAGCPTFWAVPSNPPPESPCQRGPNPAGGGAVAPPKTTLAFTFAPTCVAAIIRRRRTTLLK